MFSNVCICVSDINLGRQARFLRIIIAMSIMADTLSTMHCHRAPWDKNVYIYKRRFACIRGLCVQMPPDITMISEFIVESLSYSMPDLRWTIHGYKFTFTRHSLSAHFSEGRQISTNCGHNFVPSHTHARTHTSQSRPFAAPMCFVVFCDLENPAHDVPYSNRRDFHVMRNYGFDPFQKCVYARIVWMGYSVLKG